MLTVMFIILYSCIFAMGVWQVYRSRTYRTKSPIYMHAMINFIANTVLSLLVVAAERPDVTSGNQIAMLSLIAGAIATALTIPFAIYCAYRANLYSAPAATSPSKIQISDLYTDTIDALVDLPERIFDILRYKGALPEYPGEVLRNAEPGDVFYYPGMGSGKLRYRNNLLIVGEFGNLYSCRVYDTRLEPLAKTYVGDTDQLNKMLENARLFKDLIKANTYLDMISEEASDKPDVGTMLLTIHAAEIILAEYNSLYASVVALSDTDLAKASMDNAYDCTQQDYVVIVRQVVTERTEYLASVNDRIQAAMLMLEKSRSATKLLS